MQIPIKFDRSMRPEWIDFALETYCVTNFDAAKTREVLREKLDAQVKGRVALDKTITQMMRVIGPNCPWSPEELLLFREQMGELAVADRTTHHLRLIRTIPFFNDFCVILSRLTDLGLQQMPLSPVRERMNALYGERPIIRRALFFAFQTLLWMGVVERIGQEWKITRPELLSIN